MFASRTIAGHLARGVVGIGALVGAAVWAPRAPWVSLLLVPLALVTLRGCPTCWTIGLVQTAAAALAGRRAKPTCVDGACGRATRG